MEEKYAYDKESVKALVDWAENTTFPKGDLQMNAAEQICDINKYVSSCLSDIKEHYPNPIYNPSVTRLYKLKELLEKKAAAE